MNNNFNIEQFLDLSDYATDKCKARRKGPKGTQRASKYKLLLT